jgi:two-component system catabolic regulation response regulator CreB
MPPEKRRILIIEDEQAIADTLIYALRTEGFETEHRLLGRDGLAAVAGGGLDLLILDIGLPDINGFDLCRELRRIDRIVGLELGADDYVVKPFSPREVAVRVRTVLRRSGPRSDPPAPGPFLVDEASRIIRFHGEALVLTRYEYEVLATLIGAPGRVFSRGQLMRQAWTHPEHSLERTVDTHIKTLRGKLRAVRPEADPIRTHRGIGYSLEIRS